MSQRIFAQFAVAALLLTPLLLTAGSQVALAGQKVYVGARVPAAQQVSIDRIGHSTWDAIVRKYVDRDGMVNYQALKASADDTRKIDAYLRTLASANPRLAASREARLAFWINAYNAVTLRGMLREYPTSSIRNHTAKVWGYNIWKDLQLHVGGQPYSLEQIEHQILRKMNDPRIHFAIVCASVGCPRLLSEAYTPGRVDEQLEINARDFFARPQNFQYDQRGRSFSISSIVSWFASDFGSDQAAQLRTIGRWLPDDASRQAASRNAVSVKYLKYDWSLNDQARRRVARR